MDRGSWDGIEDRDKDHAQEKEMQKKAKWLSKKALQVAV